MKAALVAAIMSILELIELSTGWTFAGVTEEWIQGTLIVLTPILVWLVPGWIDKAGGS